MEYRISFTDKKMISKNYLLMVLLITFSSTFFLLSQSTFSWSAASGFYCVEVKTFFRLQDRLLPSSIPLIFDAFIVGKNC